MKSVQETRNYINLLELRTKPIQIPLTEANGYTLAEAIFSPIDFPSFEQSAMDGYALRYEDIEKFDTLKLSGVQQAGNTTSELNLLQGETIRIFTGSKLPQGADTVVMQEKVILDGNLIRINDNALQLGSNVRPKGSQTKIGTQVARIGNTLKPMFSSFLAGLGITEVTVFSKPTVSIINTGKELIPTGNELLQGQVYESNSIGLKHALENFDIQVISIAHCDDIESELIKQIQLALNQSDILILTGGVSVGDYDFVAPCLAKCDVTQLVHKVKQKPGKPFYLGQKNQQLIFGLPGNPASTMTCFYMYVLPALQKIMGQSNIGLQVVSAKLTNTYTKKSGLTHFVKSYINEEGVEILGHQESYKMNTFALANAIVELDEQTEIVQQGDWVKVHLLN
jgi:molybdopterin molybdotransferase